MKKQLLLILGLMITASLFAAPVSKDKAKENVLSFLTSKGGGRMFATAGINRAPVTQVQLEVSGNAYYVYNIGDNAGFVIASGDDCAEPILGYSYEGTFDPENVPVNMQAWLDGYAEQIKSIRDSKVSAPYMLAAQGEKKPFRHTIPALVTSRWNQDSPYNDQCPDFKDGYGKRPTGCLATAVAQVMYFHKWPKKAIGEIPGYTYYDNPALGGNGKDKTLPALPGTTFDWDNMLDEYKYNSPDESRKAVATLMRYVGGAAKMNYCALASGAYSCDIAYALRTYMDYDKGMKYVDRKGYTDFEWEEIIYNELANNRPVLYSGTAPGVGGHQFICDGYENEFYHFNWGWGGMSDGFYKLDALAPSEQGIGGAGNGMNFSEVHHIVIGVKPAVEGSVVPEDTPVMGKMMLTKNFEGKFKKNNLGRVTMYINSLFAYDGQKDADFTIGFGLFDEQDKLLSTVKEVKANFISGYTSPESEINGSISLEKEAIANDGTLYLRGMVKSENGEWYIAPNADKIYFKVVVSGNDVDIIQYPYVDVEINDLRFEGYLYQAADVVLKANITNKGEDIDGLLYLTHKNKVETSVSQHITLKKGETKEFSITFMPPSSGEDSYGMSINGRLFAEETTVTFIESDTKSASLDFVPAAGFTSEGNFFDIPVEITNKSQKNAYKSLVRATLYKKSGFHFDPNKSVLIPVELEPSGKTSVNVHFDDLDFNNIYYLGFSFFSYGKETLFGGTDQNGNPKKVFSKYKAADAVSYYDETGHMEYKVVKEGETFDIPANACYVEIPKTVSGRTFNKNANPNCIYKLRQGVSVPTLKDCNIIKNDYSNAIVLNDAYPFYCKDDFPSHDVTVTINVDNNLTALWLPFNPETATSDGVELKRGYSIEDIATSDYVLLPMVAEDETTIYCDFDENFKQTPCVLLVNAKYVGKSISFFTPDADLSLKGSVMKGTYFDVHVSNTTAEFAEPIYGYGVQNFSSDIKKAAPFRVYLTSVTSAPKMVAVSYPQGFDPAGIEDVEADMNGKVVDVYSVDGVKVRTTVYGDNMLEGLPSGLYIVSGKKFVK